ncbi:hypothetical protein [Deinococcus aerius]|uniref:hypothetical protein n=1 Tax=Deinococcus aerius TaxID=200253 RepID=UPI000CCC191A|nr:hypothetical protein [Deinococcus aerius]
MPGDDGCGAGHMRALRWLLVVGLALVTLALAALTLGSFASLNPNAPLWLRSVGSVELLLSAQVGAAGLPAFTRAVALTVLTSVLAGLVAFLKPRT